MSGYIGSQIPSFIANVTSASGDFAVGDDLTVDTNTLYVDSTNNRVGISTVSPDYPLHVNNSSQNSHVYLSGGGGLGESYGGFIRGYGVTGEGGHLELGVVDANTKRVAVEVTQQGNEIIFDTAGSERMRINSIGRVGIGTNNPIETLHVEGYLRGHGIRTRTGSSGSWGGNTFNIYWSGSSASLYIDTTNIGTIQVSSDYRIKQNVETQISEALPRVMQLRPVTYQSADYGNLFKASDEVKEGFIAHELAEVVPSAVQGEKDDPNQIQSLKLDALVSVLTKAIQEQQSIIEQLETRIEALEGN